MHEKDPLVNLFDAIFSGSNSPLSALGKYLDPIGVESATDYQPALPRADVYDLKDQYQVVIEVPGLSSKDVRAYVDGQYLVISGTKGFSGETAPTYSERVRGAFERRFVLPSSAQRDQIKATMKNGELTVSLSKLANNSNRIQQIDIQAE